MAGDWTDHARPYGVLKKERLVERWNNERLVQYFSYHFGGRPHRRADRDTEILNIRLQEAFTPNFFTPLSSTKGVV